MPLVERYGQRRVGPNPLPGARMTSAPTALSLGAGLAEEKARTAETTARAAGQLAGQALDWAGRLRQQEKERADQVALLDAENRLNEWETKYLYGDGESTRGVLGINGKEAMGLPEQASEEFTAITGAIEAELATDEQRLAYAKLVGDRKRNLDVTIARHTTAQIEQYERTELDSYVANKTQEAIRNATDPRRAEAALAHLQTAIRTHAPRLGLGAEAVEKQVNAATSAVRVGIINQLIATEQIPAAKAYFEETRDQIDGEQLDNIQTALRAGTVRREAQNKTEEILAGGGTITEQRQRAKESLEGEVLDEVLRRLEHESNVREAATRQAHDDMLTGVFNQLDQNPDVRRIDPVTWSKMSGAEKSAAYNYVEARVAGVPVQTNWTRYTGLMEMARDNPQRFAKVSLLQYRGQLGDTEYKQLLGMQTSIANGDESGGGQIPSFSTKREIIDNSLAVYGADLSDAEVARVYRLLDQRVAALGPGAEPSAVDYQSFVDEILSTELTRTAGVMDGLYDWARGNNVATRIISDDLTFESIPLAERRQLEQNMRRRGLAVNEQTVLDQWRLFHIMKRNREGSFVNGR
jgi:hypothetical protein